MKKRIVLSLMAGVMALSLVACGKGEKDTDKKVEEKKITNIEEAYETEIPVYVTMGLTRPLNNEGDGGYQSCIQNTTRAEFDAYVAQLEKEGFTVYSKNEVSAGSTNSDKNVFYTFTGKGIHIYLSWNPNLGVSRIIMTPEEKLPSLKKPKIESSDKVEPTVTQYALSGTGMMYIVQLVDGSYIVIDGGVYNLDDTWGLRDFMVEHAPKGQKPTIACWIYTPAHADHIQLATEFIPKYAEEIDIKSFAYNFPSKEFVSTGVDPDPTLFARSEALIKNDKTYYPDAVHYQIHAGQIFYYKGMEMEILQTSEEFYPNVAASWNDTSCALRMKFDGGKNMTFLGDSQQVLCQQLEDTYGDYMKSDVLQLAHHGLIGGDLELYQLIDPDICFWATDPERFLGTYTKYEHQYCLGEGGCTYNAYRRDASIKARTHYYHDQHHTLPMK